MKTYTVVLNNPTGVSSQTFDIKASNINEAAQVVKTSFAKEGNFQYTIKEVSNVDTNLVSQLVQPTLSLLGCLMLLVIAEWKIRKWLKG